MRRKDIAYIFLVIALLIIVEFAADWEQFKNDKNIYNEESWQSPSCVFNEINEDDTHL